MKICVTLLSELKTLIIEIGDSEPIESLSAILNTELKTINVEFDFVYNRVICAKDKTAGELNFVEDCKVYAVKKNEKPLKRTLNNDSLNHIMKCGVVGKRMRLSEGDDFIDNMSWKNASLNEIQKQLTDALGKNPEDLEPLILQPQVEILVNNPSLLPSLLSSNPVMKNLLNNHPNKMHFIKDSSQYSWIKDVMANNNDLQSVLANNADNMKFISDSKRVRRMGELFDKLDNDDSNALQPLLDSNQIKTMVDLMVQNSESSKLVLENSPLGQLISEKAIDAANNIMPQVMANMRKAIDCAKEPQDIVNFMRANPIEIDENTANDISVIDVDEFPSLEIEHNQTQPLSGLLVSFADSFHKPTDVVDEEKLAKIETKKELLNEMGFLDNELNTSVLASEFGNMDRVVSRLLLSVAASS